MSEHLSVTPEQSGVELDEFLCERFPLLAKRVLRREVRRGRVRVDGGAAHPSQRLRDSQVVTVDFDPESALPLRSRAPREPLVVLYEDAEIMVVDKPAALPVEPDRWDPEAPSLIGGLLAQAVEAESGYRPRLVHRLDKGTSGAVLVARKVGAERALRTAFDRGEVHKEYLALVEGEHPLDDGETEVIDLPVAPDPRRSGRMCISEKRGRQARTRIGVAERFRGYTLLACEPLTGRTHQIRVHLAESGFPLIVDPLYGRRTALLLSEIKSGYRAKAGREERALIDRLTLHAFRIRFPAGAEGAPRTVEAPPPADFARARQQLAKVRAPRR